MKLIKYIGKRSGVCFVVLKEHLRRKLFDRFAVKVPFSTSLPVNFIVRYFVVVWVSSFSILKCFSLTVRICLSFDVVGWWTSILVLSWHASRSHASFTQTSFSLKLTLIYLKKNGALCADCFFTSVNSIDRFAKADSYSVNFQISTSVVCLRSILLNQNYNKILERDWLSPAPFEH